MRPLLFAVLSLFILAAVTPVHANPLWTNRNCGITSMSGASQQLVAANAQRHTLEVCNFGATNDNLTLGLAGETAVANQGLVLVPGSCKEYADGTTYLPQPPANAINVIGTSGQPVSCYEGR